MSQQVEDLSKQIEMIQMENTNYKIHISKIKGLPSQLYSTLVAAEQSIDWGNALEMR